MEINKSLWVKYYEWMKKHMGLLEVLSTLMSN